MLTTTTTTTDEVEYALNNLTNTDIIKYHTDQFLTMCDERNLLSWESCLKLDDICDLIDKKMITIDALRLLWSALPKKKDDSIVLDTWLALQEAIEDEIQSTTK